MYICHISLPIASLGHVICSIGSLCPQLRRSWWDKLVSGCASVRLSVHPSVRSRTVHARVLKFHIWIPHGKIFDTLLSSCPSYLPFWSYASLKKSEWNLMHAISYEPCMLGFWNFIYGFLMEKIADPYFFSYPSSLFWSYAPLKKNQNEI